MRARGLCGLAVLFLVLTAATARAGAPKPDTPPAIVVRVGSLDAVLQNVKLLVSLAGREEAARQIEGLVKGKVGPKGLEGIDTNRPVGAYVHFGKKIEEVSGAVLVPIADEKSFLALLENLNVLFTKDKKGIYTIQTGKVSDVYFRFANGYAYFTGISANNLLDERLPDPRTVLAGAGSATVSAVVRLDLIPETAKALAQSQLEESLNKERAKKQPGETAAEKAFRVALLDEISKTVAALMKEGGAVRLDINVDKAKRDFAVKFSLAGKSGSALTRSLEALGRAKSPFAGILTKNVAFLGALDLSLPGEVKKAFLRVVDDAVEKSLAGIGDEKKKRQAEELVAVLMPSVKGGEFDGFLGLVGPTDKQYTLLSGLKLRDGAKVERTMRGLVEDALKQMPDAQKKYIKLDFAKVGGVTIHRFELAAAAGGKDALAFEALLGDRMLYVAFREDAVFTALGKGSLKVLEQAVASKGTAVAPVFVLKLDAARMAPVLAKTPEHRDLARKLFTGGADSEIRLVIEGGPALTIRLEMQLTALEFFAKMNQKASE